MRRTLIAGLLVTISAPLQAMAICPDLVRLHADPRWTSGQSCHLCVANRVGAGPGARVSWNRRFVTDAVLRGHLRGTRASIGPFTLLVVAEGADCGTIERVSRLIERNGRCREDGCNFGLGQDLPRRRH
jgi:hypothetical protein